MASNPIVDIFRVKDLRDRILFTIALLIIFRLGTFLPIPGIDRNVIVSYFAQEVEVRRELGYPPWGYLAAVRIDGSQPDDVEDEARRLASKGRKFLRQNPTVDLLGPVEAPIQRLKGRTRWLLMLKAKDRVSLRRVLSSIMDNKTLNKRGKLRVSVDVDPLMML